jgi:membrane fusion protein (multidrug efflux system)
MHFHLLLPGALLAVILFVAPWATAQPEPSGPPAVGVVAVERRPMTESYDFNGRIQPVNSVNIVARVTAFLEKKLFMEGSEVEKGDLLYSLEQAPFQAAVDGQQAAIAQAEAQLENDNLALWRAQWLLQRNAGSQQVVDNAQATQRTAAAQLKSAQAQLETSQINFNYTEIHAPIDGRIGRTSVTVGNVVTPTSGTGDGGQPGSNVRGLCGPDTSRAGIARAVCRQGRFRCIEDLRSPTRRQDLR